MRFIALAELSKGTSHSAMRMPKTILHCPLVPGVESFCWVVCMAGRKIGEEALEQQFYGAGCDEESNEKRR
jgi:hypothetical protein